MYGSKTEHNASDDGHKDVVKYAATGIGCIGILIIGLASIPGFVKNSGGWDLETPAVQFMPAVLAGCNTPVPPNTDAVDNSVNPPVHYNSGTLDYKGSTDHSQYYHCIDLQAAGGAKSEVMIQAGFWTIKNIMYAVGATAFVGGFGFALRGGGKGKGRGEKITENSTAPIS